jgi:hypothetical protein
MSFLASKKEEYFCNQIVSSSRFRNQRSDVRIGIRVVVAHTLLLDPEILQRFDITAAGLWQPCNFESSDFGH